VFRAQVDPNLLDDRWREQQIGVSRRVSRLSGSPTTTEITGATEAPSESDFTDPALQ
jgi:hypothetical protein